MQSKEYRAIIASIVRHVLRKHVPGAKDKILREACKEAAIAVHARMYGANVDNVDSPIFRDGPQFLNVKSPTVDARELLGFDDKVGLLP